MSRLLKVRQSPSCQRKCITVMMKLVAWHLSSNTVQNIITNYAMIFGGKMCQLCVKQTGLCRQISTKLIKMPSECTKQQWNKKHFKVLLTVSIECTSFSPALTFGWSFYDIPCKGFLHLHSFSIAYIFYSIFYSKNMFIYQDWLTYFRFFVKVWNGDIIIISFSLLKWRCI